MFSSHVIDNFLSLYPVTLTDILKYSSLVPRPSSLTGIVSHEEKVKYRTGGKEEEEEKIRERKAW